MPSSAVRPERLFSGAGDLEPAHRAAAGQHHREDESAGGDRLAAPRHAPELLGDQAADRLELVSGQRDVEEAVHCRDGRITGDPLAAIGQGVDAALAVLVVELVLDLADDLLEHVLDGQQARGTAELVDDDGQVVAVGAKVAQQIIERLRLRHEDGRAQESAQAQVG